ncbi:hypothetical protein [Pseudoalteromonas sp. GABNS16H]|uniref:hypothetical protein n=1 Tax=Pseudoalteromonas sp. GABNS16H TaxID=3025325 RepID=UPI00235E981D|nr:hypothetical protein [Pseudoalteromonas sp. GABNS16H]MDC9611780.1 hypothetical protein [Pseudoalteromonas sp. GABNS16H]
MIEGALSEKATDFTAGLKAWLLILMTFGVALGVFIFLGVSLDGWGSKFASVEPGLDGFQMAIVFVVHLGFTFAMFIATCFVGIHLVAGANRLLGIYNQCKANAAKQEADKQERLANWEAQQDR